MRLISSVPIFVSAFSIVCCKYDDISPTKGFVASSIYWDTGIEPDTTTFTYSSLGHPVKWREARYSNEGVVTYDNKGRITRISVMDQSVVFTRDSQNKIIIVDHYYPDVWGYRNTYDYNEFGQVTTVKNYVVESGIQTLVDRYEYFYSNSSSKNPTGRNLYNNQDMIEQSILREYDNKKRPFLNTPELDIWFNGPDGLAENNIIKVSGIGVSDIGDPNIYDFYTYTYNAEGYPTKVVKSCPCDPSFTYNWAYTYAFK